MPISKNTYHIVQYYETDQMRVVHHANYVKWMEEARNNFFKDLAIDVANLERNNVFIPVLSQSVNYIKAVSFGEEVRIECKCQKFNGVKLEFVYEFYNLTKKEICAIGKTSHGFVNSKFEPLLFKDNFEQEYNSLKNSVD